MNNKDQQQKYFGAGNGQGSSAENQQNQLKQDIIEQELRSNEEHLNFGQDENMKEAHSNKEHAQLQHSVNPHYNTGSEAIHYERRGKLNDSRLHLSSRDYLKYYDLNEGPNELMAASNPPDLSMINSLPQNKWRAKLYQLNAQGSWDDFGTGDFQVVKDERDSDFYMLLISEEDHITELLKNKIQQTSSFSRQRDTIITWMDDENMIDYALSFQESKGAQETWETICIIQGKDPNEGYQTEVQEEEELQMPTFDNLQIISDELQNVQNDIQKKRKYCQIILQDNCQFLIKLHNIFSVSDDIQNLEHLYHLFYLYKSMLSLGDNKIIETLLSREFYLDTLGALEYDPEVISADLIKSAINLKPEEKKAIEEASSPIENDAGKSPISPINLKHRDFLQNKLKFKQVVKIQDIQILDAIHLVYRLNYLKDTAIARFIDDSLLANINALIYMKSQDIVNHIFYNVDILYDLLQKMRSHDMQTKHDAIEFFLEVCQLAKNLQIGSRYSYFEQIKSFNLIEILAETLNIFLPDQNTLKAEAFQDTNGLIDCLLESREGFKFQDENARSNIEDFIKIHDKFDIKKIDLLKIYSIEILMNIMQFTPTISVRSFILSEDQKLKGYPFIKRIAYHILYSFEQGIKIQISEFLKLLIDNEQNDKKVDFNDILYKEVINIFLNFLNSEEDIDLSTVSQQDYMKALEYNKSLEYSRSLVVQILIKCNQEHTFRFRIYAVSSETLERVARLTRFRSKLLNVWIIKFFKTIIKTKDDAFVMYLIKKNLLKTIVDIFLENPNKTNMLHSTILELFDYLTNKDHNKKIATVFIQQFSEVLFKNPKYERYFTSFINTYEGRDQARLQSQDQMRILQRELIRKEDEDLMTLGRINNDGGERNGDDEDERYNQEMFLKRKAEMEKASIFNHLERRKSSSGGESSSDEEEDEQIDMGLYGSKLQQFKQLQKERKTSSPQREEKQIFPKRHSPLNSQHNSSNRILFELNSAANNNHLHEFLMDQNDFVQGKRLIDPVTGQTEGDSPEENNKVSAFDELSKSSTQSKRMKIDEEGASHSSNNSQMSGVEQYPNENDK